MLNGCNTLFLQSNKVLDTTHSKNIEALELARGNGIILNPLPVQMTNLIQSLEVSFFRSVKVYYTQTVEKWQHATLTVTQFQVAELIAEAYGKVATYHCKLLLGFVILEYGQLITIY